MIRDDLTYHRPTSAGEAAELLAAHGDQATVLGGGTVLVPQLTRAERRAQHVVDLRGLGLNTVESDGDMVEVGAMVTYGAVLRTAVTGELTDLLVKAAEVVTGGCQIRNLGTLGGSAAYANPSSDVPGCLVALEADMVVAGPDGSRTVSAADFFVDAFTTALGPGEFLSAMRIRRKAASTSYVKVKAGSSGWPVVAVAATRDSDTGSVRIAIGAAQGVPVAMDVTDLLDPSRDPQDLVGAVRDRITDPWQDEQASARYRKHVSGVLARRAIEGLDR